MLTVWCDTAGRIYNQRHPGPLPPPQPGAPTLRELLLRLARRQAPRVDLPAYIRGDDDTRQAMEDTHDLLLILGREWRAEHAA